MIIFPLPPAKKNPPRPHRTREALVGQKWSVPLPVPQGFLFLGEGWFKGVFFLNGECQECQKMIQNMQKNASNMQSENKHSVAIGRKLPKNIIASW